MARFSIRQLLALTALCAGWFATFNPGQLGLFAHIALGYLFVVGVLVANRFNAGLLGSIACAISRALTAISSLFLLLLLPIVFQTDASRQEHWESFWECISYLTLLVSTFAAAEWNRIQSQQLDAPNRLWLVYVGVSTFLFGIAIALLAFAPNPRQQPEDNLALGIVLFNATYFVAYAMPASWRMPPLPPKN